MNDPIEIGIKSDILRDILTGGKTIEGRLARGKFLAIEPGDVISIREDIYEDGVIISSKRHQAQVKVTQRQHFASFGDMLAEHGYTRIAPSAGSNEAALQEYRLFYSPEDETRHGVVALTFELIIKDPSAPARTLYPSAKTTDQRIEEDEARVVRQRKELPRAPWLFIPFFGGISCWLLLQFIWLTPQMWRMENSGLIFITFAMWLFVAGVFIAWVAYCNRSLYAHGRALPTFWVGFAVAVTLAIALHFLNVIPLVTPVELYLTYVAIAYAIILFALTLFLFFGGRFLRKK